MLIYNYHRDSHNIDSSNSSSAADTNKIPTDQVSSSAAAAAVLDKDEDEDVDIHSGCYVVKNKSDSVLLLTKDDLLHTSSGIHSDSADTSTVQLLLKLNTNIIISVYV